MKEGHRTGISLGTARALPPSDSYWANGCSREELMIRIRERRAQQRLPSEAEMQHEPGVHAMVALFQDHQPRWKER